jgi:hypothetical protein
MSTLKVVGLQNPASPTINGTLNADGTTTFNGVVTFATGQTFPSSASTLPPGSPSQGSTWYDTGVTPAQLKVWNGSAWVPVSNNQSGTAPTSPTTGQQWTDTSTVPPVLKLWNGSAWIPASVAISNGVAPVGPVTGQLWSDTSTTPATLKAFNGSIWVPVQAAGSGGISASLLTATGDMIYASAASTPARLGIGTAGQVLTVSGGVPAWTTIAAGGVTSVTGTAPIASSGGATPAISLTPGTARQLLQTNAGGTAAEFASNIDVPGTLDVTGVATFDGIASHPLGTAAAPSVTFTGDTDTGIYSPGAGRISLANNGTNTVEVTAAGTVLIGGTLPGSPGIGLGADGSAGFNSNVTFTNNSGIADNIIGMTQVVNSSGALTNMVFGTGTVRIGGTLPASPTIELNANGSIAGVSASIGNTPGVGGVSISGSGTGNGSIQAVNPGTGPSNLELQGAGGNILIGGTLPASPNITLYNDGIINQGTSGVSTINRIVYPTAPAEGTRIWDVGVSGSAGRFAFNNAAATGWNAAATGINIAANSGTSRSINAAGTLNASGTDYAEYMVKSGDFVVAKGDIVGVDANGMLTNVHADSVTFVIKSTDPSYVGGDSWGDESAVGEKPLALTLEEAESEEFKAELAAWEENFETVRQTVDRIAFSGQVPVNVTGATPGQYIVPVANADGGITGEAKDESDLTLVEYMRAVGKVIAIEDDGRARVIVKVA